MTNSRLNDYQRILVETHLYLVKQVIRQHFFTSYTNVEMNMDDLTQIGSLALCKAALKYDNERPFPAYAKTVIRNALFDYARRLKLQSQTFCYLSEEAKSSLFYYDCYPDSETENYLLRLEDGASGIQKRKVHAFRMNMAGYSPTDISKLYGVTASAVRIWLKNCKQDLSTDAALIGLLS